MDNCWLFLQLPLEQKMGCPLERYLPQLVQLLRQSLRVKIQRKLKEKLLPNRVRVQRELQEKLLPHQVRRRTFQKELNKIPKTLRKRLQRKERLLKEPLHSQTKKQKKEMSQAKMTTKVKNLRQKVKLTGLINRKKLKYKALKILKKCLPAKRRRDF